MSSGDNPVLYAAVYSDYGTAAADFAALKSADEASNDFKIEGSVVVTKNADGKIDVKETGGGQLGGGDSSVEALEPSLG
jgi:hypothetical protein